MKSTRSPRRGVPKPRVLRSRDGRRPPKAVSNLGPLPSSSILPALPHSQVVPAVPPLPLSTAFAHNSSSDTKPSAHPSHYHPKLSARLVPCLQRAFSKLDEDTSARLTKADILKHNQVLADAHDAVELSSSDIDMLFLVFDSSRRGVIDRHAVVRHLAKLEIEREFHTKGTARPCHTSRKQCTAANTITADQHQLHASSAVPKPHAADIFTEPRFTPQVPPKQSPRSLAW